MGAVSVGAIKLYRSYVSPYKGFQCANNVVFGTGSCSDFGLKVFRRYPMVVAVQLLKLRFQACHSSALQMSSSSSSNERSSSKKSKELSCVEEGVFCCSLRPW